MFIDAFAIITRQIQPACGGSRADGAARGDMQISSRDGRMSRFEWDEEKNAANQRKHGISFEEASMIFDGPVLSVEDEADPDEVRERSYGLIGGLVVACVVHTDRDGATRIISARKATRNERTLFDAYLKRTAG